MRLKKDYALRQIADTWVVLALAEETVNFSGMLTLNDSGAMLWNVLKEKCELEALVDALMTEYEVSEEQAKADAQDFINKLIEVGCIEV